MTRPTRPASARWALLVLTASALALAGCGRKGGLDLPPQASSTQPMGTSASAPVNPETNSATNKGNSLFAPSGNVDDTPATPAKGRKRPFILDPILD